MKRPPEVIHVTYDRKYGITIAHDTKTAAVREHERDREWIDLLEYVPRVKKRTCSGCGRDEDSIQNRCETCGGGIR